MRLRIEVETNQLWDADTEVLIPTPWELNATRRRIWPNDWFDWPPEMGQVCYTLTAPRLAMLNFVIDSVDRVGPRARAEHTG